MDRYRSQKLEEALPGLYSLLKEYDPLQTAAEKISGTLDMLEDAYIVNVQTQDVEISNQLEYTQIQILRKKSES
jgi:hypothetical protein